MSGILIRHFIVPSKCMECEWRDAEACGQCELMIGNPFMSLSDQYAHCPFQMIAKRHPLVPVPPHGRLIDADALMGVIRAHDYPLKAHFNSTDNGMFTIGIQQAVDEAPTIIPAEEGE